MNELLSDIIKTKPMSLLRLYAFLMPNRLISDVYKY